MSANVLDPEHAVKTERGTVLHDPPLAQFLFSDTRMAAVWLVVRVLLGWSWMSSGLEKLGNPEWMQTGVALKGFWEKAVVVPESGRPAIAFDWYRNFIQGMLDSGSYVWFAKVVALGETVVGLMLIIGLFVGVAAFLGAFMNWNYIMAGSASSNGLFGLAAIVLILAWKTAGYYGLDRYVLPRVGMTWQGYRQSRVIPSERVDRDRRLNPQENPAVRM